MRFFDILQKLKNAGKRQVKYVPYKPNPGEPNGMLEASLILMRDFLPSLVKERNLTWWGILFLSIFPNAGYALTFNVTDNHGEEENSQNDDSADKIIIPSFYQTANVTNTIANTTLILDNEMIRRLNANVALLSENYRLNQTVQSAKEYLQGIRQAQNYFQKQKDLLQEKKRENGSAYKSVLNNLVAIEEEISLVKDFISTQLQVNDLGSSFKKILPVIITKLRETSNIEDIDYVSYEIKIGLKNIQEKLNLKKIKLNEENESSIINLIATKINNYTKKSSSITITDVKKAFRDISRQFIKTAVATTNFYWPGDFAVMPDGMIVELPDTRLDFYGAHSIEYLGKKTYVKPLFLHREEMLNSQVYTRITKYFTLQKNNAAAIGGMHLLRAISRNGSEDPKTWFPPGEVIDNLIKLLIGDEKLNVQNAILIQKINNLLRGDGSDQHLLNMKNGIIAIIKERMTNAIKKPQFFCEKMRQIAQQAPVLDEDKVTRQKIIASFNKQEKLEFSRSAAIFLANMPDLTIFTLPTDLELTRMGRLTALGEAQVAINTIYLCGYDSVKIPDTDFDFSFSPIRPSVYGGVSYNEQFFTTSNVNPKLRTEHIHYGFEQIMLQESFDLVLTTISPTHQIELLFGNNNNEIENFKIAIRQSQLFMLRLKNIADKVIQGHILENKTSKKLPDEIILDPKFQSLDLNKAEIAIEFNEQEVWQSFTDRFTKDFSNIKPEPRYLYVKVSSNKNLIIGKNIAVTDPLLKTLVTCKIEEVKTHKNNEYVKVKLPDITDPKKIHAYILRELADNILNSVLDTDGMPYQYDIAFEIPGRTREVYNKFQSGAADLAFKYLKPSLKILDNVISKAIIEQFFQNINIYLQNEIEYENVNQQTVSMNNR